jgi:hypothetical protein
MVAESVHIYTHRNRVAQDCRDTMASASTLDNSGSIEHHERTQPSPLSASPPYETKSYAQSPLMERSPISYSPYPLSYSPTRHDDRPSQRPRMLIVYDLSKPHRIAILQELPLRRFPHPILDFGSKSHPLSDRGLIEPHSMHPPSSTADYPRLPPIQVLEQGIPSLRPLNPRCTEDTRPSRNFNTVGNLLHCIKHKHHRHIQCYLFL